MCRDTSRKESTEIKVVMLDAQMHALGALSFYLGDPAYDVSAMLPHSDNILYHDYLSYL